MSQPYASGVSSSKPLAGQDNRSGENFSFFTLPSSGSLTVQVQDNPNATTLTCTVMEDVSGGRDPVVASLSNGATVAVSKFSTSKNYYLASPNGTSANFAVIFVQ